MNTPAQSAQQFFQQALAAFRRGDVAAATAQCAQALAADPQHFDANHFGGLLASQTGDFARGVALLGTAIATAPNERLRAEAYANRAYAFQLSGRFAEALSDSDAAIAREAKHTDYHFHRASALQGLGRLDEAAAVYDSVLALDPRHVDALYQRAAVLMTQDQPAAAAEIFRRALVIAPNHAYAHNGLGNALNRLGRPGEALASFESAIRFDPRFASPHINRGHALHMLGRREEALASLDRAVALDPNNANAHGNRSTVLGELGRKAEAFASVQKALALNPDYPYLRGLNLHYKMCACDWTDFDRDLADLLARIDRGERVSAPPPVLGFADSPEAQRKAAEIWMTAHHPENAVLGPLPKYPRHARIRLGYFSADFHNHATAHLMAELFECHDRTRFEVAAFSFGPATGDEMQARLAAGSDRFIDVRGRSDREIAALAREMEIDIAVDLKGLTDGARPGIFAHRAAPVQALYLGYPGTMGSSYHDFIIADATIIPPAEFPNFSEKVVHLPNSYQVNDRKRKASPRIYTRAELGLPDGAFVFCSFNNNFKITPAMFGVWMRILAAVPGSVLWLMDDNPQVAPNLRREAAKRGVDPARLVFCGRVSPEDHLARHAAADLFLDTAPCCAHTTASDALWVALPLITCPGRSFVSRVAASLLKAVGLPELIAPDFAAYESLAVALARDPARLHAIKQKLQRERSTAPLFDTPRFTRDIEAAYARLYQDSRND